MLDIFRLARAYSIRFSFYHCNIYVCIANKIPANKIASLLNGKSHWTDHKSKPSRKKMFTNVNVHILIVVPMMSGVAMVFEMEKKR